VQVSKLFRAGHVFGFCSLFICSLAVFCGHSTCHRWLTGARNQFSTSSSSAGFPKDQQPKPIEKKQNTKTCFRPQDKLEK